MGELNSQSTTTKGRADIIFCVVRLGDSNTACRYWMYQLQHSGRKIGDGDVVDDFLRQHFLHWLESLSLMGKVSETVGFIDTLQSLVAEENSQISFFLQDARRFVLTFNHILVQAPLQAYAVAWYFSPLKSTVRSVFQDQALQAMRVIGGISEQWNTCLLTFEGHSDSVHSVVFSPHRTLGGAEILMAKGRST
jgi:hypothetical protein